MIDGKLVQSYISKENEEMIKYKTELSDHLILMKLMNEWKDLTSNQKKDWCI